MIKTITIALTLLATTPAMAQQSFEQGMQRMDQLRQQQMQQQMLYDQQVHQRQQQDLMQQQLQQQRMQQMQTCRSNCFAGQCTTTCN